jgi:pilus assembly protein CpaE
MVRANEKLCVLSAEAPINQPMMTDGSAYFQLQEEMRTAFETTVLDLPRNMLVQHPHLVHDAHVCIVVVELTLAGVRDAIRILSWLKANAPQSKLIVVANRVTSGAQEISRKDFEKSIERSIDISIPLDLKAAAQAAKLGQPIAKAGKNPKISQPLAQLVSMTVAAVDGSEDKSVAAQVSPSLLEKLGGFKALVAKKPKAEAPQAA